jgi:hypothetical protein
MLGIKTTNASASSNTDTSARGNAYITTSGNAHANTSGSSSDSTSDTMGLDNNSNSRCGDNCFSHIRAEKKTVTVKQSKTKNIKIFRGCFFIPRLLFFK